MIADFRFAERPQPNDVVVRLSYGADGERLGAILVPPCLRSIMAERGYPSVDGVLPIESALAFAMNVAMNESLPLIISGDPTVWDPVWGVLKSRSISSALAR